VRVRALIIATGIGLLMSACASANSEGDPSPSASVSTTSSKPSETPEATETPEPTETPTLALGKRLELEKGGVTIQVTDLKKDAPSDGSIEAGQRLDVALVKACNGTFGDDPDGAGVGTILRYGNFTLIDADSGEYQELDLIPSPAPQPQLHANDVLAKGTCKKGWIAFALPKRTRVVALSYRSNGESLGVWGAPRM
jgi:hypothetical protein